MLLNTDHFKQGYPPLHLYKISPFLPQPTQSIPLLTFHSPPKERFKPDYPSSPLPFSTLSKQSSLFSTQRPLSESYHHTGDHNKIISRIKGTLKLQWWSQISMCILLVVDSTRLKIVRRQIVCHVKWVNPSYTLCLVSLLILLGHIRKWKMGRTKEKHRLREYRKVGEWDRGQITV